ALYREVDDKDGIALALVHLATVCLLQGEYDQARTLAEESVVLSRERGGTWTMHGLWILALVISFEGDFTQARALLEKSLALSRAVGNKWFIAGCLVAFATLAAALGEWTWAARLSGAAETLCKAINGVLIPGMRAMQELTMAAARAQLGEEVF